MHAGGPVGFGPRPRLPAAIAAAVAAVLLAGAGGPRPTPSPAPTVLPAASGPAAGSQLDTTGAACPSAIPTTVVALDRTTGGPVPLGHLDRGGYRLRTPWYRFDVAAGSGIATLDSAGGSRYTRLPLVALAGFARSPRHLRITLARVGAALVVTARAPRVGLVSRALVEPAAQDLRITFTARLGPDPGQSPRFFFADGRGLALTAVTQGFTADGRLQPFARHPSMALRIGIPFAPAPFDLSLRSRAGWFGVGLVQVPDATKMALAPDGAVVVNYPLPVLAGFRDRGAGGVVALGPRGRLLGFPSFLVTFGSTLWGALAAYRAGLAQLGAAPVAAPPGRRPAWWSEPLVDTWGQQMATGLDRGAPGYTAAWVRRYVATWIARFRVRPITVVIDSQWQARLGSAEPRAAFGGIAGMRRLIAKFHHEGLHVLLWWPLWVDRATVIPRQVPALLDRRRITVPAPHSLGWPVDPTAPSFAARLRREVALALGRGPEGLGADGLKVDWGSWVPDPATHRFARPQLGVGAAALARWYRLLYADAQQVHPAALIDTSAVAPQFGGFTDLIRLYDSHSETEWQMRAAVVSAVDPATGIDGDGWRLTAGQAVAHLMTSSVYGTPASYFATEWADHLPITTAAARLYGAILRLAAAKGQGEACPRGAGWSYFTDGVLTARTLDGDRALLVVRDGCAARDRAVVLSAVSGRLAVPFRPGGRRTVSVVAGRPRTLVGAIVEPAALQRADAARCGTGRQPTLAGLAGPATGG